MWVALNIETSGLPDVLNVSVFHWAQHMCGVFDAAWDIVCPPFVFKNLLLWVGNADFQWNFVTCVVPHLQGIFVMPLERITIL